MSSVANMLTTDPLCPRCGHSLKWHTEAPGLWCCFYDAARGKLCECHGEAPQADEGPRIIFVMSKAPEQDLVGKLLAAQEALRDGEARGLGRTAMDRRYKAIFAAEDALRARDGRGGMFQ